MEILSPLLGSTSKTRLLSKIIERPRASFSVSELGRLADLPKASVSVIVGQWEERGLVLSQRQGRNKLVSLNPDFYLLPELKKIFDKTKDFQRPLIERLKSLHSLKSQKVKAVVVFGSRSRGDFSHSSDLDVLVGLENKNSAFTERILEEFVQATNRAGVRFSPVFLGKNEIRERWREKDQFLLNALKQGRIIKGVKWLGSLQTAP